jgi:hypothetical protein
LTRTLALFVALLVIGPDCVRASPPATKPKDTAQSVAGRVIGPGAGLPVAGAQVYAIGTATVVATQPGTSNDVGILLAPGGQIRGTVRDADGRPMAGVLKAGESTTVRFDSP